MTRILAFLAAMLAIPAGIALAASPSNVRVQVVDERGMPVRDAVVEIDVPGPQPAAISFPWHMAMAQKNQQFAPGTLIVPKGATVAFPNLDNVRHSIYSFSRPARFEINLYGRDQTRTHSFPISGTVALGCNIHDQMRGYIRVVDTPYAAKTDGNGIAVIGAVPTGNATLTVWHPRLRSPDNTSSQVVAVGATGTTRKVVVSLR